ncbi:hypothetical protein INT45_001338 [Circinella minor]|uniref:Uncharacterized protein n=1 Tax=Circinella minor TaxID=1195481 RepID=A0A8H7S8U5_9FUNG|nr:hypothetical protein INT45_001338 [Circinella minor]
MRSMTKTHAGRQSGAKMADIRGAGESDIRRAGQGLLCVMTKFYKNDGRFYLRRAIEKPEPELCMSIAADGFLQMLRQLSIVFLQDSVPFQKLYSRLSIWNAPLFQDLQYIMFKNKLTRSMNEGSTPQDLTLQMAMPLMHDYVHAMHTYVSARLASLTHNMEQQAQCTSQFLDDLLSGRVPFFFASRSIIHPKQSATINTIHFITFHYSHGATIITTTSNTADDLPYYKMSRGITNLYDLWREWHTGSPAVL